MPKNLGTNLEKFIEMATFLCPKYAFEWLSAHNHKYTQAKSFMNSILRRCQNSFKKNNSWSEIKTFTISKTSAIL